MVEWWKKERQEELIEERKNKKSEKKDLEVNINVYMDKAFKDKIDWLVSNYDKEIGAFIVGEYNENGIFLTDLLFPKQDVSGGMVEISGKQQIELRKEYGDKCLKVIGEFHSHNTMGAFWSSDDEKVIRDFAEVRDVSIFIVGSKSDGHLVRVEVRKPFGISINGLDYYVIGDEKVEKEMLEVIKTKIQEKKYHYNDYDTSDYRKNKNKTFQELWSDEDVIESGYTISDIKTYRKIAGKKIRYFQSENKVKIVELSPFVAECLATEFNYLNPLSYSITEGEDYTLTFNFDKKDREKIKKFMKEAVDTMSILIQEEDFQLKNTDDRKSGIPTYDEVKKNPQGYLG